MKCSACGAQLPDDSTFCVECGGRVEAKAGSNGSFFSSAGDLGGDLGGGTPISAPAPDPAVSLWDTYSQPEPAPAAVQPPVPEPEPSCPRCGAPLEAGAIFCVACGLNLKSGDPVAAERNTAYTPAEETAPRRTRREAPAPAVRTPASASKSNKGLLIGIAAGVLALVLLVVIIGAATNWFGLVGPGTQVLNAVNKTVKKGNFTVEFSMSDGYSDFEGTALVNIDQKNRDIQLYMELDVDGDEGIIAIYDGYVMVYSDGDGYAEKISSELDDIFDAYEAASSGNQEELTDMLEDMGMDMDDLEDYYDVEQLEKSVKNLVKKFNSKSWLADNAGYTSSKNNGATVHSLEPDIQDLLVAILEVLEPAFQDPDDYEDAVDSVDYIDDVDILVEIGVKSGYLASVNMEYADDYDELEIQATFTDIGKTKIDVAELEEILEDCD